MDENIKKRENNVYTPAKKNWHVFMAYIFTSYLLTQVVVDGSNRISKATDSLFAGGEVVLKTLVVPFVILTLIGTVAAVLKSLLKNTFSIRVHSAIKNMTAEKLVKIEYSFFDREGTGSIMNKLISDVMQVQDLFSEVLPEFIMAVVTAITVGIYIMLMDYKLFLVTMTCYPLLFWAANKMARKLKKLTGNRRNLYDKLENTSLDAFNGMIVGRTYNLYDVVYGRICHVVDAILKNEYMRTWVSSIALVTGNIMRWIPKVVCYLFALYEVYTGNITVGGLLAFSILLDRMVHPLGEIPGYMISYREMNISVKRINDILSQPDEASGSGRFTLDDMNLKDVTNVHCIKAAEIKSDAKTVNNDVQNVIELEDIAFSYDGERQIFNNLSLTIEAGKQTALVGSSGGGKSTVFKLLCGLYVPQGGTYKLYGHAFEEWDIRELRKNFSLVSQNVFLFPDTISANVAYGHQGATRQQIEEACRNANIHDFIMTLPEGYDTYIGERGVKMSGGQRQRLSIARAFLKNAPILLLDEPTSAVDVETEQMIKNALDKISVGKTVVTIAHRLSTIENADKILVFDNGKIAESGSHDELLAQGGIYSGLYNKESRVMNSGN